MISCKTHLYAAGGNLSAITASSDQ